MKRIRMKTSKVLQAGGGRVYYRGGKTYPVSNQVADELVESGAGELVDDKPSAAAAKPKKKPAKKSAKKKKTK